ncbi:MAG: GTP-binding protein [candidate division KSB1 bacterium]|nr:GTP-binding protein [candidate division KSB1 bacterium]
MAEGAAMIPTILLTGFLGAGKTTLLNRLIGHYADRRLVLLINEFGTVGIDGRLLREGNYEKVELNRGSLFCICVRTDFIAEVERIAQELRPDLLLIEATGLADTSEMEKMLALPALRSCVRVTACVCVVDCQTFPKIKGVLRAPVSQVRSADLVLVNKCDLVPPEVVEQVSAAVQDLAPHAQVLRTQFADFPLEILDTIRRPEVSATGPPGEGRPDPLFSYTLQAQGDFDRESWERFVASLGPGLTRMKGFISLEGQQAYVDATMANISLHHTGRPADGRNEVVIIGQGLQRAKLEASFLQALRRI